MRIILRAIAIGLIAVVSAGLAEVVPDQAFWYGGGAFLGATLGGLFERWHQQDKARDQ